MNEVKLDEIAQIIVKAEREIALGKDVQFNKDKIEYYMTSLSFPDLCAVILIVENLFDNNEKF